jgi:hypothetical protein
MRARVPSAARQPGRAQAGRVPAWRAGAPARDQPGHGPPVGLCGVGDGPAGRQRAPRYLADADERHRLRELHQLPRTWVNKARVAKLTKPKPQPAR